MAKTVLKISIQASLIFRRRLYFFAHRELRMWQRVMEWALAPSRYAMLIVLVVAPLQSVADQPAAGVANSAINHGAGTDTSFAVNFPLTPQQHAAPEPAEWVTLLGKGLATGFVATRKNILTCGAVRLDPTTGNLLAEGGAGVIAVLNKLDYDDDNNLISKESFADCEVSLEFLLGKGSNSGVKLQKRYEIQLYDSQSVDEPTATDCGGIYPHWVFRRNGGGIHYVDEGVPPKANASRPAGQWQELHIVFKAPRFDDEGEKTQNAVFELVTLNGRIIHQNVEITSPTGNIAAPLAEVPQAPLYLQMDHGPVAFRNVRVRPLSD